MIELKRFIGGWALGTMFFFMASKHQKITVGEWFGFSALFALLPGLIVWGLWP